MKKDGKGDNVLTLVPVKGETLMDCIQPVIDNAPAVAKVRRAYYLAHIDEGFTADEALILCMDTSL